MKYFSDNNEYNGTPQEIAELIKLLGGESSQVEIEHTEPHFAKDDFMPLETVVNESKDLRAKLAEDPSYNPYGGVVPPKDNVIEQVPINRNQSELDTGVEYA